MKPWILSLLVLCSACLMSCTQSEVKKMARQNVESQYNALLEEEIKGLEMPGRLRDNYLAYLKTTAHFEVMDVKIEGDAATVSVREESVAEENRKTLAQIAAKLEPAQASAFNMGNAINLIEQQPGQIKGKKQTLHFVKMRKSGSGWVIDAK